MRLEHLSPAKINSLTRGKPMAHRLQTQEVLGLGRPPNDGSAQNVEDCVGRRARGNVSIHHGVMRLISY